MRLIINNGMSLSHDAFFTEEFKNELNIQVRSILTFLGGIVLYSGTNVDDIHVQICGHLTLGPYT